MESPSTIGDTAGMSMSRGNPIIASFHVVRYRRPMFRQSSRWARSVPGLRLWVPMSTGVRFDPPPKPDFHRWGYLGIWADDAALDRFLEGSPTAARWADSAKESWHVRLHPTFTRGEWRGLNPFTDGIRSGRPDSPAAVITWARLRPGAVRSFWFQATKEPAADFREAPGMLNGLPGFPGKPFIDIMTFTLWNKMEDAMAFAYRRDGHRGAIKRARADRMLIDELLARFYPYSSSGTWDGVDPLASVNTPSTPSRT